MKRENPHFRISPQVSLWYLRSSSICYHPDKRTSFPIPTPILQPSHLRERPTSCHHCEKWLPRLPTFCQPPRQGTSPTAPTKPCLAPPSHKGFPFCYLLNLLGFTWPSPLQYFTSPPKVQPIGKRRWHLISLYSSKWVAPCLSFSGASTSNECSKRKRKAQS